MPNAHRERYKSTNNHPAHDGLVHRRSLMWSNAFYENVFTLNTPSLDSAYHHQVDTVGFKQSYFNPNWHLHTVLPSNGMKIVKYDAGYSSLGPGYGELEFTGEGLFPERVVEVLFDRTGEFGDFPGWLDDFSAQAEYHFKTAVKEDYSLINLIIETIQLLEGNVKKAKDIIDKINKALKSFRDMYKRTGDYWLSWNFCIKPTLRDIKSLMSAAEKARKRLAWLKKRNHIPTLVKYKQGPWEKEVERLDFPVTEVEKYVDINNPYPFDMFRGAFPSMWSIRNLKIECKPAAHALVQFDIDDVILNDEFAMGGLWLAISGLYNPLEIVWEAVPYSWLVDWFLSKRAELTRKLASLSPFRDASILQSMHSLKWTFDFELGYTEYPGWKGPYGSEKPPTEEQFHPLGSGKVTLYRRVPELPKPDSSIFRVPLEWYNVSIIAALLQQKKRR